MRVLQLIDSLQIGGAERTAVNYANLLTNYVEASYLCATRKEGALKSTINDDVGYVFLNKKHTLDLKAIKKLNNFIRSNKINIVHAHSTSYVQAAILRFFNSNVKIIWHDHNGSRAVNGLFKNILLKLCSLFFSKIIVVNTNLKTWAKRNLFTKYIYCVHNFSVLNAEKQCTVLKGENGKRIVCLANLRHPKNHMMLLKAFKIVSASKPFWSLHLVGEDFYDAYSNKIKGYIAENELEEKVFIYGLKQDINNILNQCDIGVLSSKSEGLPLSLLEYGLVKLAVVATNVGDCNKVITKKEEGTLVDSNNFVMFSDGLLGYINNINERKLVGKNLYDSVTKNFNSKKNIERLISIYNKA